MRSGGCARAVCASGRVPFAYAFQVLTRINIHTNDAASKKDKKPLILLKKAKGTEDFAGAGDETPDPDIHRCALRLVLRG